MSNTSVTNLPHQVRGTAYKHLHTFFYDTPNCMGKTQTSPITASSLSYLLKSSLFCKRIVPARQVERYGCNSLSSLLPDVSFIHVTTVLVSSTLCSSL